MLVRSICCTLSVLGLCIGGASALTVSSSQPGNLFVAGKPLHVSIRDAHGSVSYEQTDYFGRKVAGGTAAAVDGVAQLTLPTCGLGWYQLTCADAGGSSTVSLGVVLDRGNAPLPVDGRVCSDAGSSWLLRDRPENVRPFAKMVRMAGIPWLRERLDWGGTEPARGKYDWSHYQEVADILAGEGIHIYQIWHFTPEWARPGKKDTFYPDDLRDAYGFAKSAAHQFAGTVGAWETWNEPDGEFWPDLSDRLSSYSKAAALGVKAANPKALVLQPSLCVGVSAFGRGMCESGLGDYWDVFNWHIYNLPSAYPGVLNQYRDVLRDYHLDRRPSWLTEAGIAVPGTEGDPRRLLNDENQVKQCRFVPRSVVMSLVAGDDKHFFFVLPDYLENGVQFGSLRPDLTPYPAFVALSAAANILGQSKHIGEYKTGKPDLTAEAFSTPHGTVLVAWSEKETELSVPTDKRSIRVADIFGAETQMASSDGKVSVKVGPDAVYLIDVGDAVKSSLVGKPAPMGVLPKLNPSKIILAGHADLPIYKPRDCYFLGSDAIPESPKVFRFDVEVYNFDEKAPADGAVAVTGPAGWVIEDAKRTVRLEPMGRQALTFTVKPGHLTLGADRLVASGIFGGKKVSPSVSHFLADPAALTPAKSTPIEWSNASKWVPSASADGKAEVANPSGRSLRISAQFAPGAGHWAYPEYRFERPVDLSAYDGIAFRLKTSLDDKDSFVRLMLVEPNGAHYITGTPAFTKSRRLVFLFSDMTHLAFMGPDPDGKLDLNSIASVKLGMNTNHDAMAFDFEEPELVRFQAK